MCGTVLTQGRSHVPPITRHLISNVQIPFPRNPTQEAHHRHDKETFARLDRPDIRDPPLEIIEDKQTNREDEPYPPPPRSLIP